VSETRRLPAGERSEEMVDRSQRIRTLAGIPVIVALVEAIPGPAYLQIAGRARHLRGLGLTQERIARELGVSARTVAKALLVRPKSAP
jgi:hypothetical protein